jgi:hypothetical protein
MTTTTTETTSDTRIAALLAQLPDEEQAMFARYYQKRLQEALGEAQRGASHLGADPDAVERELLDQLVREAEGRDDPDGLGAVPTSEDAEGQVVPPDSDPRVNTAPGASGQRSRAGAASAGAGAGSLSRGRIAAGVVVLLLPVVWLVASVAGVLGGGSKSATPTPATTQTAPAGTATPLAELDGGKGTLVWYPSSLEIPLADHREVYRIAASQGALGGTWAPETGPGIASWLQNTFINTIVCLPPSAADLHLAPGQAVQLRNASGALRRYTISAVQEVERQQTELLDQRRAGLTLVICGTGGNTRQVLSAVYRPELPGSTAGASSSTAQELPGVGLLTLQRAATISDTGALAQDGQQLVGVTVVISNTSGVELSLADLAAQLQLSDGQIAEAAPAAELGSVAPGATATATWRYRVPVAGGGATLRVLALTGQSVRLPVELPAAPLPTLRATLAPDQVRRREGQLHLTLLLEAQGGPLELTTSDVLLLAGDQALALDPQSTPLPLELSPGSPAQLDLFATLPPSAPALELRVRGGRWRIRLPKSP